MGKDRLIERLDALKDDKFGGATDTIRLSLIQMGSKENDRDANVEKACQLIEKAMESKPNIILLPEFFNIEYFCCNRDMKYLKYAEKDDGYTISKISDSAKKFKVYIIATILEYAGSGLYFDTAMIIDPNGEVVGKFRKIQAGGVRSVERLYFKPASQTPVFDILGWKVGFAICYDNFFPEITRCAAVKGAELILAPYAAASVPFWNALFTIRAVENGVYYAGCNKVGREMPGEWVNMGKSAIVSPSGEILVQAGEEEDEIISTILNKAVVDEYRTIWPIYRDRRPEVYGDLCRFDEDVRRL
jgi:predicted amidohydrolase